ATWASGVLLFCAQLVAMCCMKPGVSWWYPFAALVAAHFCFCCYDVAAISILGDIVDYGKLKFRRDRGTTYFALNLLVFKVGLGIGGGLSLWVAGTFAFNPAEAVHTGASV